MIWHGAGVSMTKPLPTYAAEQCRAVIVHDPHSWMKGNRWCSGVTFAEYQRVQRERREHTEASWWHLVSHHRLPMLSKRTYSGNRKLWEAVHDEFHRKD